MSSKKTLPTPPKHPMNAPSFYFKDNQARFQKKYPDLKQTALMKIIMGEFKNLPSTKRKEYDRMYEKEREKFEELKKIYENKYGPIVKKSADIKYLREHRVYPKNYPNTRARAATSTKREKTNEKSQKKNK